MADRVRFLAEGQSFVAGIRNLRLESGSSIQLDIFNSILVGRDSPATHGIVQHGPSAIVIQGSKVAGLTRTVESPLGNVSIASTYLQGGPITAGGTLRCMGVWDENEVFFPNTSPP